MKGEKIVRGGRGNEREGMGRAGGSWSPAPRQLLELGAVKLWPDLALLVPVLALRLCFGASLQELSLPSYLLMIFHVRLQKCLTVCRCFLRVSFCTPRLHTCCNVGRGIF